MSSRVYFHSLYKTRDYSYSSSLESPTFHFGFKGVDYRTLTSNLITVETSEKAKRVLTSNQHIKRNEEKL